MINVKIILLLSLAAYVACGGGWSAYLDKAKIGDRNVFINKGGVKFIQTGDGQQSFNQGNRFKDNDQSENTNKPKTEDSDNKDNYYSFTYNNADGKTFKQKKGGKQIFNQGNRYASDDFKNKGKMDDRSNVFINSAEIEFIQMVDGEQSINQGNLIKSNNYKSDATIHGKGKPQNPKKSPKQEPVKSNVQDQGVNIHELPSSSSNTEKSPTINLGLPEKAQINNRDVIVVKPQTPTDLPEQEPIESNCQEQGVCSSGLYSSSSNTPNSCRYTDGGNGTTDSFEEGELVVFQVGQNDSIMYWMVIEKDSYYPEPNIKQLFYTIKPCQPDYQDVLKQLTASEIEGYVHYQYYGLHDEDEQD